MLPPPPDVVVARTLRALTRALLACCGAGLTLGLLAIAILALAGGSANHLTSGLVLLGVGQAGAIAGAGVVGLGLRRVVGAGSGSATPPVGATPPGGTVETAEVPAATPQATVAKPDRSVAVPERAIATTADAAAAERVRAMVGGRLTVVARGLLGLCVLVAAAWTLVEPTAALGSLLGALVSAQVAVLLLAVRRQLTQQPARGAPSPRG